jgi:hypothetical protein
MDLLREFDMLTSELADLAHRVQEVSLRWGRIRRALVAMPTVASGPEQAAAQRTVSMMDVPGHVVDALAAIPRGAGPIDAGRLARRLKVTPSVASARLQRAAKLGLVRRVGRGQYVLAT